MEPETHWATTKVQVGVDAILSQVRLETESESIIYEANPAGGQDSKSGSWFLAEVPTGGTGTGLLTERRRDMGTWQGGHLCFCNSGQIVQCQHPPPVRAQPTGAVSLRRLAWDQSAK